jgi:hypothetical protein
LVVAVLGIAASAQAALPPRGASFSFADHATTGKNWHVDFTIDAKRRTRVRTLIVYSEACGATAVRRNVAISAAGVVAVSGGVAGGGAWAVNATFQATRKIVGTMRMNRANCDTGVLGFPSAITGDGGGGAGFSEHDHEAKYPDIAGATLEQRRQAVAVHREVLALWHGTTLATAKRRGYHRLRGLPWSPGFFHLYNDTYESDKRIFDAHRPESLVFWRPNDGSAPVLVGTMFRVSPNKRPSFAGPIPIYHHHARSRTGRIRSYMTHVWMVASLKNSWANCLPILLLEAYNPPFKWLPAYPLIEHVNGPC